MSTAHQAAGYTYDSIAFGEAVIGTIKQGPHKEYTDFMLSVAPPLLTGHSHTL